jgi:2-oxoglutarate/2-oxoacid ferredoxin oxidoreductase subunit alpha
MRKLAGIAGEFPGPELVHGEAGTLLVCWGSTVGPVLEALDILRGRGHELGAAVFRYLHPMNKEKVRAALSGKGRLVTIEGNYVGQLGQLLLMETGIPTDGHIRKIDGRLFTVEDVVSLVEGFLSTAIA